MPPHPCNLRDSQRQARGQNQKWRLGVFWGTLVLIFKKNIFRIIFFSVNANHSCDTRKKIYVFFSLA